MLKSKEVGKRWAIFPVVHEDLWKFYKDAEAQTWVAEEIDLSADVFSDLSDREQDYLKQLLAFFAISDSIVLENLNESLLMETGGLLEAQYYYGHQTFIEQVHSNMYALLIDTYIDDTKEQNKMYNAITEIDTVRKKSEWATKWLDNDSFAHRLVAFSCVEGLAFSSTFAGIFYFRSRNKMSGLCEANELIMSDENSHYEFALNMYHNYLEDEYKLSHDEIRDIVLECCEVEKTFVEESLPTGLIGLQKNDMIKYVEYVADTILLNYGLEAEFNSKNPLKYMDRIALKRRTNFFEKRQTEYTRVAVPTEKDDMFDSEF